MNTVAALLIIGGAFVIYYALRAGTFTPTTLGPASQTPGGAGPGYKGNP